jgi:hypothetical protein
MRFWLAVFDIGGRRRADAVAAQPILYSKARRLALEIVRDEASGQIGVLLSNADLLDSRGVLTCCIGFANGAKGCSVWRDRGFPLIDARIWLDGDGLHVASPYFGPRAKKQTLHQSLLDIRGVDLAERKGSEAQLGTRYDQSQWSPDYAWPGRLVTSLDVRYTPTRSNVTRYDDVEITIDARAARSPNLVPLDRGGTRKATVWTGDVDVTRMEPDYSDSKVRRSSRADTFGVPAFRFEDVEVLGFRLDAASAPGETRRVLDRLAQDLNFHLDYQPKIADVVIPEPAADFRYRVATSTVVIELLRYGAMKLRSPCAPLGVLDYQSQHELVVRVLVGRVDDDSAQAHSPAAYVPAIFVDNPWSKVIGRDLQGFDKRMAHFCVQNGGRPVPLEMNGHLRGRGQPQPEPEPLDRIERVYLVGTTGTSDPEAAKEDLLLELDCSAARGTRDADFAPVDIDLALNSSALAFTRWRRSDFVDPEFRRSFARSAVGGAVRGFRSVQVSPVGQRNTDRLRKTWITGTFTIDDDVRVAPTRGVAALTLHNQQSAPQGWRDLCDILRIEPGTWQAFSFPAGSWYRMKFSMDLTIDTGLE